MLEDAEKTLLMLERDYQTSAASAPSPRGNCVGFAACTPLCSGGISSQPVTASAPHRCFECGEAVAKARLCEGCRTVYYCTAKCQRSSWHRKVGGHRTACERFARLRADEDARVLELPFADAEEMAARGFDM